MVLLLVAACSLPRGAALKSEIAHEANADNPTFQVVEVTRSNIPSVLSWPMTGWHGHYHWLDTHNAPSTTVIRTGDRVTVTIWDSQENSLLTGVGEKSVVLNNIEVGSDGTIFVPYIENVAIRGLSPASARARIQEKMEPIVPSAQVQLSVEQGQSNSVDVVSGVASPGTYPLPSRNYTILSALSRAGGISNSLRNPIVRLLRGGKTYEITAERLFESGRKDTVLAGGDKIIVEEDDRSFTALGATGNENLIYFPKDDLTAIEALSLMNGLQDNRADPKGVLVLREYSPKHLVSSGNGPNRQQVVFTIDLTSADGLFAARQFLVHPGDTILATESPVTATQTVFGLIGSVLGLTDRINSL